MKPYNITGLLTDNLKVDRQNTDEQGILRNCIMLQQVANINDKAILETFGHLNFSIINISRYHVYFHETVLSGDTLSINAAYTYSDAGLTIEIKIQKTKTRKKITVLTGDFTFINGTEMPVARMAKRKNKTILFDNNQPA